MRAYAILTVVYAHSEDLFNTVLPFKHDGVGIFFVLSGFLIGKILLAVINKPGFNYKHLIDFWVRRWLRTLPAYYFVVTALILLTARHYHADGLYSPPLWKYYFFFQSVSHIGLTFFPESWSLSVEEWFYLVVPFLFFLSLKLKFTVKKTVIFWIVFILLVQLAVKLYLCFTKTIADADGWFSILRGATILRLDSIMLGVLGAFLQYYQYKIWLAKKGLYFYSGIFLFFLATSGIFYLSNYIALPFIILLSVYLNTFGALLILPMLSTVNSGKGHVYKAITFISTISYSMYLLNLTPFKFALKQVNHVVKWMAAHFHFSPLVLQTWWYSSFQVVFYFCFVILGAYLLNIFIERPFMRLRKKIKIA